MIKHNPRFTIGIAADSIVSGSFSATVGRDYVEPRPKMKTKADMLKRIEYLEGRVEENNHLHAEEVKDLRLRHAEQVRDHIAKTNADLIEILKNGTKGEQFPRRS